MIRFILKVGVFCSICGAIGLAVMRYTAGGHTDPFYARCTSSRQSSMILGTSLAAMGIRPEVLNRELGYSNYALPLYNFAFTIDYSPYNPPYLVSIKRKLAKGTRNGLFILEVNPFAFKKSKTSRALSPDRCPERRHPPNNVLAPYVNPNLEYFIKNFHEPLYTLLRDCQKKDKGSFLHADGWYELKTPDDPQTCRERLAKNIRNYRDIIGRTEFSQLRFDYFEKTIEFLKLHGAVVIVRTPVAPALAETKAEFVPDFAHRIRQLAARQNVLFLDYARNNGKYRTLDGHHLTHEAATAFSRRVAQDIRKHRGDRNLLLEGANGRAKSAVATRTP